MAIILAIEPERRQRDTLAAIVRHSVGAELILADTTEHALEAIGNRVPDLVLVPALLSPTDDAALAAALRVIAAAAHVRTLTIPVLAAQSASEGKSGLFSRWRRGNAAQVPDGCDPALFAEQIIAYLKESAAERAQLAEQEAAGRRRAAREEPLAAAAVAPAELHADVPPDLQAFTDIHEADYPQPEMPVAAHARSEMPPVDAPADSSSYAEAQTPSGAADAFSPRGDDVYTRADAEIYTPADAPVPVYTPTYSFGTSQPLSAPAESQPDEHVYAREHDTVDSEPVSVAREESQPYASPDEPLSTHHDFSARLHDELVAHVNSGHYDAQPLDDEAVATPAAVDEEDQDAFDLSGELEELDIEDASGADEDLFDGERIGIYTMPSVVDEPDIDLPPITFGRSRSRVDPEPARDPVFFIEPDEQPQIEAIAAHAVDVEPAEPAAAESEVAEAARTAEAEVWAPPTPSFSAPAPRSAATSRTETTARPRAVPADAVPAAPAPAAAAPKRDRPEWSELVASLRKDIQRRRVDPPQEKPKPAPIATTEVAPPAAAPAVRRSRKAKPIQDEWGFFDPEQCGFAALLAKLDEITEGAEEPEVRQTT